MIAVAGSGEVASSLSSSLWSSDGVSTANLIQGLIGEVTVDLQQIFLIHIQTGRWSGCGVQGVNHHIRSSSLEAAVL